MKRLLSVIILLAVVMSIAVIESSAAVIYMQDDFSGDEINSENWVAEGTKFFVENGMLQGYKDAVVHQSAYGVPDMGMELGKDRDWTTFVAEMKVRIIENDAPGLNQGVGFWIKAYGDNTCDTDGQIYTLGYDHTNKAYVIGRNSLNAVGDANIISTPAEQWKEGGDAPWHTLGIKVEAGGLISLWADAVKVLEINTADTSVTGSTEEFNVMGIYDTPVILLNDNNYIQMDDLIVASPDYYSEGTVPAPGENDTNPPAGDDTNNGVNTDNTDSNSGNNGGNNDNNGSGNNGNTGNNGAGNINPNATDTNKNQSGAASTGDCVYILAVVFVVTLGSAIVVKKAGVR